MSIYPDDTNPHHFPEDYTGYPEIADDDLDRICKVREELCEIFHGMRRRRDYPLDQIDQAEALALEGYDDLCHKKWHALRAASQSSEWGACVGSRFGKSVSVKQTVISVKSFRPLPGHIVTNPATLMELNKFDGDVA